LELIRFRMFVQDHFSTFLSALHMYYSNIPSQSANWRVGKVSFLYFSLHTIQGLWIASVKNPSDKSYNNTSKLRILAEIRVNCIWSTEIAVMFCSDIFDSGPAAGRVRRPDTEAGTRVTRCEANCSRLRHVRQCIPRWHLRPTHALQRSDVILLRHSACICFSVTVLS